MLQFRTSELSSAALRVTMTLVTRRVLVVDDEESICQLLEMALQSIDANVITALSGEEALELFEPGKIDAIVLDKNLPGMSGMELAGKLREKDNEVSIIMMTGFGSVSSALEMLHLRVERYVEKPFDVEDMLASIDRAIAKTADNRISGTLRPIGALPASGTQVFVVSPDADERASLTAQLSQSFSVRAFSSSSEALEAMEQVTPTLIVADDKLLGPSALEMLAKVRTKASGADFGLVARTLRLEDVKNYIEIGLTFVLQEPLSEEFLKSRFSILSGSK